MKIRRIYISILFLGILLHACNRTENSGIPSKHPRVYLTSDDLPSLKKKTELPEFADAWQVIKESEHPFMKAFEALVTENKSMAAKAAKNFLPILSKCTDARSPYNEMQMGACIYDWCYYLMSDSLKQAYIHEFIRIAAGHAPFYPAKKGQNVLVGHNTEGWILSDQLPAGLAIYDENPVMFDSARVVFFDEFVPARNFVYKAHMHHQGDSYSPVRFLHDLFSAWLFRAIGTEAFSGDMHYVPYQLIYNYRSDGQQMRDGDTFDDQGNDSGGQSRAVNRKALTLLICGSLYEDPYLLEMFNKYHTGNFEKVFEFIITPIDKKTKLISELPLSKYFDNPMGEIVARTGWNMNFDSNDALIQMRIGSYFFGNHQTKDFGTFQIYYKGPLAIASGAYQGIGETYGQSHWLNYHHQTISKNGLLIYDPDEKMDLNSANDGGQRWPNKGADHPVNLEYLLDEGHGYKMAEVTAHSIGPDSVCPKYSYISGNITPAYSAQKAEFVERSMLTINTGNDEFPVLFFVFDKVQSTRKEFKKTWLIHSIQEPEVAGSLITIVRNGPEYGGKGNYNGKLLCRTILPQDAQIVKVGGPEKGFWIESSQTNYFIEKENPASEEGAWRVEVSPRNRQKEDLFFHVMAITEAEESKILEISEMKSKKLKGAAALGFAAFFNADKELISDVDFRFDNEMEGIFIGGIQPGRYEIRENGKFNGYIEISEEAKCFYMQNAKVGNYEIKRINNIKQH